MSRSSKDPAVILTVLTLTAITPAHAYIDPGTGSMILTAVLGALAAGGYAIRRLFSRIRSLFGGKEKNDDPKF